MYSITKIAIPSDKQTLKVRLPLYQSVIPAGFPSPAEDYIDKEISLDEQLINRPSATYFARAKGDSMEGIGISDGALLIVDRSLMASHGDVVIASIDGEFTCKQLDLHNRQLVSANSKYKPIKITQGTELEIEGVVIHCINSFR
ncbi:MAG: translesion error-prone DNA polymerase V autoproteolytic subunit [Pseudomonadales bacterium]